MNLLLLNFSEHVRLLEAIEQYGYGNWEDISKGIIAKADGSNCWKKRSPLECKEEYCNIFLNGLMGKHTWKETERSKTKDHTQMNPLLLDESVTTYSLLHMHCARH